MIACARPNAIEAPATFDGYPFRLVDTAGLRDTTETVERIGVDVSRKYLAKADIVLHCVEAWSGTAEVPETVREVAAPCVMVRTKTDLLGRYVRPASPDGTLNVSALTGTGLPELRDELVRAMFTVRGRCMGNEPIITRQRQRVALEAALAEMGEFRSARAAGVETAVAATHLRAAVAALEVLVGVVTPDDVLDQVLAAFCVGK